MSLFKWSPSLLQNPSPEQAAVAKVVLASLNSPHLEPFEKEVYERLPFAGLTVFARNIIQEEQAELKNLLSSYKDAAKKASDLTPLIAIDQEGGRVRRLKGDFFDPGPPLTWEQGESDQQALASLYDIGQTLGQELGQFGLNINFAPVCDLFRSFTHPAIGDRCLGKDPVESALRAKAFLSGLQDAGVHGCLKHFPGQGRATSDTHLSEGRINCSAAEFEREDLRSFELSLPAAQLVMMSHCIYPFWSEEPAGFSPEIVEGLLKEKLGFSGLVLSDDLLMEAVPRI